MHLRLKLGFLGNMLGCLAAWAFVGMGSVLAEASQSLRDVELTAKIRMENRGSERVQAHVLRLTIPVDITNQQKVLRIVTPGPVAWRTLTHPNQVDKYLEHRAGLTPHAVTEHKVQITLRLSPFHYKLLRGNESTSGNQHFLRPSTFVESASEDITALAKKFTATYTDDEARLLAAYRHPQQTLAYRKMDNRGALFAVRNGFGDCTEYAAVFAATARAMGYPARLTSEFNFDGNGTFDQPNHHAAEVFLDGQWVPVDPNLGLDRTSAYGFGHTGVHKIVLKRDGSWVWSTTARGVSADYQKTNVRVNVHWTIQQL
jgi:transglutaminase-like putative cysteine protease